MDVLQSQTTGGSLQISVEVIEKIAKQAALEVEGVCDVTAGYPGARSLLDKIAPPKAVHVELKENVADIEVSIVVLYGTKIPEISEKIQESVKNAVQNMTSIIVVKVDVIVNGIEMPETLPAQESNE